MLKGSRSYTSHVWNASIARNSFFISRKRKFLFLGGVLLGCLLALIPNRSYALQKLVAPDANTGFSKFENVVGRGCLTKDYELSNGTHFQGGVMFNHSIYPCGWHKSNGNVTQSSQSDATKKVWKSYRGDSIYEDRNNFSGSGWDYSDINGGNIRPMLRGTNLRALRQNSDAFLYFTGGYGGLSNDTLVLYGFNYDSDLRPTPVQPRIDTSYYHIYIKDEMNRDITDELIFGEGADDQRTYLEYVVDSINKSVVWSCSNLPSNGLNLFNDHFPSEILSEFSSGYENYSCFLAFHIPYIPNASVKFDGGNIAFSWPPSNMDWHYLDGLDYKPLPNIAYSSGINGLSYGESNQSDLVTFNEFSMRNPKLVFITPDNSEEYNSLLPAFTWLDSYHDDNTMGDPSYQANSNGSGVYMGWFDVFRISFIFPFSSLFNSFTNNSCVNIPIIASMVGSSNTQYCTWWPDSIRNILTPVFTMISLMVITGFVIHWLSDRQTSISGSA